MPWKHVCPSVCHMSVLCLKGYTYPQTFIAIQYPHHSSFFHTKQDGNIPTGTPIMGVSKAHEKIAIFHQYLALSRKWCKDRAIVTVEGK